MKTTLPWKFLDYALADSTNSNTIVNCLEEKVGSKKNCKRKKDIWSKQQAAV